MKLPKGAAISTDTDAQVRVDKAVVDTGPLLSALAVNYVSLARLTNEKKSRILNNVLPPYLRPYPHEESYQRAFLLWFGGISKVFTTSHVIGELQGHSHRLELKDEDRRDFWFQSVDFLRKRNMSEELLRLLDLCPPRQPREPAIQAQDRANLLELGPTDAGLIKLARENGLLLLTQDGALGSLAGRCGVLYKLVKDLSLS